MNKRDRMKDDILKHGFNLKAIFPLNDWGPVELAKKLHRLETRAHRLAEEQCNEDVDHSEALDRILQKAIDILGANTLPVGKAMFINQDPRGYALKIDDQFVRDNNLTIYRDWGGYGIIAPDFSA